jgi:hypothetical protein
MSIVLGIVACAHAPPKPPPHIDQKWVEDAASEHNQDVLTCYQERIKAKPKLEGELDLNFKILPTGKISEVVLVHGADSEVDKCVLAQAKNWKFEWHARRETQDTLPMLEKYKLHLDSEGRPHSEFTEKQVAAPDPM